jgi:DNA topoisomerase-1
MHLQRSDPSHPGICRVRRGRGFGYVDTAGVRITDSETLERIRGLAIPPAWTDVWISPSERGHLQAVGTDAAGRRQYVYHERWRQRRDREKFERMLEFARRLPKMRRRVSTLLESEGLERDRVLACALRLLDRGLFRIGSETYAENGSFGLATIRKEHVRRRGDRLEFDFVAKAGQRRLVSITDPHLVDVVGALKRRRGGEELLAYRTGERWCDVRSNDVSDAVKEFVGGDFSAKDFRTWHATVLAAVALDHREPPASTTERNRVIRAAVLEVADQLGNTPAVCRSSYIDPRVFDRYRDGWTIAPTLERLGSSDPEGEETQERIEAAVLDLLEERDTSRVEAAA